MIRSAVPKWLLALVSLEATWMIACERWREGAPGALAVFLVLGWTPLCAAWQAWMPRGWKTGLGLGAGLVLFDVALDMASPYPRRFAFAPWEAARLVAVGLGALAATKAPSRLWPSAAGALRVLSAAVALLVPASMIYIGVTGSRDETQAADAALVLGFALDDDGRPRPQLLGRMERAVALVESGTVPRLVLSGGVAHAGHTEASVMRELAVAQGVPVDALVLDVSARSTIENFACSRPLLDALGARRVLVVTEPWHMARSMLLARRHGLDARAAPASSAIWKSPRHAAYWLWRDAVAFVVELARQPWARPGICQDAACEGCRKF